MVFLLYKLPQKDSKKQRYLNLNTFNNRNAITKTRFPSPNLAINTTKWYNVQEDIKLYENFKRKETENEIYMIILVAVSMTTLAGKHWRT